MTGTIVYLDVCALKRPFDDSRNERIRREAEAVARTFENVENDSLLGTALWRRDQIHVEVVKPDQLALSEETQP